MALKVFSRKKSSDASSISDTVPSADLRKNKTSLSASISNKKASITSKVSEKKNSFFDSFLRLRLKAMLIFGSVINFIYSIILLVNGLILNNHWLISVSVYYVLLGLIKLYLTKCLDISEDIKDTNKQFIYENRIYRTSGFLLLGMHILVSSIIVFVIFYDKSLYFSTPIIFLTAFFTVYSFITSISNLIIVRKKGHPCYTAIRAVNLCATMTSMFTLQTALLSVFGNDPDFAKTMNITTGSVIYTAILAVAIVMIVRSYKQAKQ